MVTLQSMGESLHVNSCPLEQLAENTSQKDSESLEHDGEIALGNGGGSVVITGVEDGSQFADDASGVVAKGVSGLSPFESDGGSEVAKGVEDKLGWWCH